MVLRGAPEAVLGREEAAEAGPRHAREQPRRVAKPAIDRRLVSDETDTTCPQQRRPAMHEHLEAGFDGGHRPIVTYASVRTAIRYDRLPTERTNRASRDLDRLSPRGIAALMNREDARAVRAVGRVGRDIAAAVELIVSALRRGGRLFFVGAGTSGRLGVLEAAECPPTFGTPPARVQAIMAGGRASVFRSREGAEDDAAAAARAIRSRVRAGDVVIGVSASGVTPFVRSALVAGRRRGAATVLVACNAISERAAGADVVIAPAPGPEVVAGSTRLKAGTATKLVLNTLTTASMVRLGKVYGNRMVDLKPRSRKLRARALRLVQELAGVTETRAREALRAAGGHARLAIVIARTGLSARAAAGALRAHGQSLRGALASAGNPGGSPAADRTSAGNTGRPAGGSRRSAPNTGRRRRGPRTATPRRVQLTGSARASARRRAPSRAGPSRSRR